MKNDYISHYGRSKRDGAPHGSGRYPLGSGSDPYQHGAVGSQFTSSKNGYKSEIRNVNKSLKQIARDNYDTARWRQAFWKENQKQKIKYAKSNDKNPDSEKTRMLKSYSDTSKAYLDYFSAKNDAQVSAYQSYYKAAVEKYGEKSIKSLNVKTTASGAKYLSNKFGYKYGSFNNGNARYEVRRRKTYDENGNKTADYRPTKVRTYYH